MKKSTIVLTSFVFFALAGCDVNDDVLGVELSRQGSTFVLEVDNLTDDDIEIDVDCRSNVAAGVEGRDAFSTRLGSGDVLDRELDILDVPADLADAAVATCIVETPGLAYEVFAGASEDDAAFRALIVGIRVGGTCILCDPDNQD